MAQAKIDQGAEIVPPTSDLLTAEALGRRVATITRQIVSGRQALAAAGIQAGDVLVAVGE